MSAITSTRKFALCALSFSFSFKIRLRRAVKTAWDGLGSEAKVWYSSEWTIIFADYFVLFNRKRLRKGRNECSSQCQWSDSCTAVSVLSASWVQVWFSKLIQPLLRGLCSRREADVLLSCAHYMLIKHWYLSSRPLFRFAQHVMAAFFIVRTKVYARENKGVRSRWKGLTLVMVHCDDGNISVCNAKFCATKRGFSVSFVRWSRPVSVCGRFERPTLRGCSRVGRFRQG